MNKAQNAQIQVNLHVVFTVYCHYLHDLGENSHITQHRQHDCTTVSLHRLFLLSQLQFLSYVFLSSSIFCLFVFCFLPWGVGGVKGGEILLCGKKPNTIKIKPY